VSVTLRVRCVTVIRTLLHPREAPKERGVYPQALVLVAEGVEVARHVRCFERDQTIYQWQHYIDLVQTKPGALRNGAPFKTMPEALQTLQRHLLRHAGGDRVMTQVLAAVPVHGLEAVIVAAEVALEAQRPSAEKNIKPLTRQIETALDTLAPEFPELETLLGSRTSGQGGAKRTEKKEARRSPTAHREAETAKAHRG